MIEINLTEKNVLITGGTKGIGLETALLFSRAGAQTYLTHKWGSADEVALMQRFDELEAKRPILIQADVSVEEDTKLVIDTVSEHCAKLDVFISNVGFALHTKDLNDYKKRSLYKTLDYSSWPIVDYTMKIKAKFGVFPRYILGVSSDGPDHYYPGYDFVAASKAMLEFLAKYLAVHVQKEGSSVNIVRYGTVKTESFKLIFGEDFFEFSKANGVAEDRQLSAEECGKSLFALCSGMFDAMNGQTLHIDYGLPFQDNLMNRFLSSKTEKIEQ